MKKWTKEEETDLLKYLNAGLSYTDIAVIFGRTRISVSRKAQRLGYKVEQSFSDKQYKEKLLKVNPGFICLGTYINSKTAILHKCKECKREYNCRPDAKLRGYGCKYCSRHKCGNSLPKDCTGLVYLVYLVYIPEYNLYKIGITSKSVKERMYDSRIINYELILFRLFSNPVDAETLEKVWLSNVQDYKVNTGVLKSGNTETFRFL